MTRLLLLSMLFVLVVADSAAADPELTHPQVQKPELPSSPQQSGPAQVAPKMIRAAIPGPGSCSHPQYPAASLQEHEEGAVRIDVLVDADGHVAEVRIGQSSGHERLDQAVRDAFASCRFTPGTVDGVPVQAWTHFTYTMTMQNAH